VSCLSFSDDDHDLALAELILPQPTITAVLDVVGWLDLAAEIAAIDLGLATLAADVDAVDAPRHGLAGLGGTRPTWPALFREGLRRARRQRHLKSVQRVSDRRVIADDRAKFDDPLLAEPRDRRNHLFQLLDLVPFRLAVRRPSIPPL
jgi:hypothetical protein